MIVLDASVLIAHLDAEDAHHSAAAALLTREVDETVAVNVLTMAEVLVVPTRDGRLDRALAVVREMEIRSLGLPADAASRLARLRAGTGLRMPDCCVLLSAEHESARIATFDVRLARAAEELGLAVVRD